ncbi:CoA transferase [Candidatus Frankia alpina]|uniref:CoA transferase n=1 Tax=Candidatus Frankia alpina TaxID=2699483 RepID=A0A4S5D9Q3_9ACTN|nr:CoA transferase [Candidatus Frankia alpina]THJ55647.1 CoA transferase [Candidatus Frankia alpina]
MAQVAKIVDEVASLVGEPDIADRLTVAGPADVLPSLYRVMTVATASVAAAAVGAGRLLAARAGGGGGQPDITVDTRHAGAAFRSERHLLIDGKAPPGPWDPISGYYPTADGRWIQLHCNFPHHRNGVLDLLGAPNDRAAVERVILRVDAAPLELELQAMGLCASMARSEPQWAEHRQAGALADLSLIEVSRLGDAPPARFAPTETPAAGLRVLDLTRVIAGPIAGRTLAAYGADVLRVGAAHLPEVHSLLVDTGFGKRNAFLNLRVAADARRLRELIASADVVLQAYRPSALDRLGFGPDAVARMRPGIVYASISAYGRHGPWSGLRGFDSLVQTASGIAVATAEAAGASSPQPLLAQALDHGTGYLAAFGVLDALARRAREGGSWHVRVSLARTGRWLQELGHHDTLAQPDPTADDVAAYRACLNSEFGELSYIRPAATVAGVAPRWVSPPAPLGTSPAAWAAPR